MFNAICINYQNLLYGELECFQSYEMLLDIQKLFIGATGGLSRLSKMYNQHA
jgi:hypothetical protein